MRLRPTLVRSALLAVVLGGMVLAPSAHAWIYWGHDQYGFGVGRAALDGSHVNENFVAAPPGTYALARGVAVDSGHIYWGTHGLNTTPQSSFFAPAIGRSSLTGTDPNYVFTAGIGQAITGLSVSASHIYWSDNNQDTSDISRTPIAGGQQYQAFSSTFGEPNPEPCGVATDGTYVYFANRQTSSIGRAPLADFSVTQDNVQGQWIQLQDTGANAVHPCGVAVDDKYVYWGTFDTGAGPSGTDTPGTVIGRALKADGSDVSILSNAGDGVTGLALAGGFLYASNIGNGMPGGGSVVRLSAATGAAAGAVTGLTRPYGVAADAGGPAGPPAGPGGGITPPPPPRPVGCTGCGGGGPPAATVPPDFSRVWGSHKTFAVALWSTPVFTASGARAVPKGTVFNYILTKAGTVTLAITRRATGRRVGRKCVAPRRTYRKKRACRRTVTVVTLTRKSHKGHNGVRFSGRIRGKALAPGHYVALFVAKATKGKRTKHRTFAFTIVKP